MENASKALIIAGSVLIALMIIGALILMFSNLSSYQETNVQDTREAQVIEFNNQYETYNRKEVRGSDLYSLLNRATDYNERKSTKGTEGASIAYEPIVIKFTMDKSKFTAPDNKNRLFTQNEYMVDANKNNFEENISKEIKDIEEKYGTTALTNLTTGLTKVFIEDPIDPAKRQDAVDKCNSVAKSRIANTWNDMKPESILRNRVYKYYEYVQFKRAYFDCNNIVYNNKTGRITQMEFRFNGKFQ